MYLYRTNLEERNDGATKEIDVDCSERGKVRQKKKEREIEQGIG